MNIPLINITKKIEKFINNNNNNNNIYIKLESYNPTGSIKDRIAKYILDYGEKNNLIDNNTTILCSSSGNTGISIAMQCALRNYKCIIFTNKKCSSEKKNIIKSYGAEIQIIDKDYEKYEEKMKEKIKNSFSVNQYKSELNIETYKKTLGPELKNDLANIDYIVVTGSSLGTVIGLSEFFLKENNNVKFVFADPYGSDIYNYLTNSNIKDPYDSIIEGAGKKNPEETTNISRLINNNLIKHIYKISDEKIIGMCRFLSRNGFLLGGSSGLNVYCAVEFINKTDVKNKNIIVICPDSGYRYLSKIYNYEKELC